MNEQKILDFWEEYCLGLSDEDREEALMNGYDVWDFGEEKEISDALVQLILDGQKVATTGLLWSLEIIPEEGSKSIVLDGEGTPRCITEYIEVEIRPFNEVDFEYAKLEGEGYQNIEEWRQEHWRIFSDWCAEIGKEPSEVMPVVCQKIKVVYKK